LICFSGVENIQFVVHYNFPKAIWKNITSQTIKATTVYANRTSNVARDTFGSAITLFTPQDAPYARPFEEFLKYCNQVSKIFF
jgi:hypothetical protein